MAAHTAGTRASQLRRFCLNTRFIGLMPESDQSTPKRVRYKTVNIRVTDEELAMARTLGNGNASHGYRMAVRHAARRAIKPIELSTLLRAAAEMAADLEGSPKRGAPAQ